MELTADAEARVRAAIAQAEATAATVKHRREVETRGAERFAAAWDALQPEARWWIQCQLAERAGEAEPGDLDPGVAARLFLAESAGRQGETHDAAPLRAAVRELFAVWVESGGIAEVGNRAHRRTAEQPDHPTCVFVADHLLRLFPDRLASAFAARQRADTYLRELDRRGELATREKPRK